MQHIAHECVRAVHHMMLVANTLDTHVIRVYIKQKVISGNISDAIRFIKKRGAGMKFELNASMMCADFGHMYDEIKALEEADIDSFHVDIMDGRYVPNFAMSLYDLKCIAENTDKPLDVHLMIEHPRNNINMFLKELRPGDTVYIHPEAEYHPSATLQTIIDAGMIPGIAINPGTSVEAIMELMRVVDKILVMSVNPGSAGQMFLPYVDKKITKLLSLKEEMNVKLYWDGACSYEKIQTYAPKGIDGFILGSTILFGKDRPYKEIIDDVREMKF